MSITPFRPHITLLLAVPALLFAGVAFSQDQSDRPPWARKPKSDTTAGSNSKSSTTSTSTAAPSSSPAGEPGKIVQPTSPVPVVDSSLSAHKEISFEQEAAAHFIRQVLRPGDRLSVFAFDENVTQVAAFSDNVAELQSAVRKIPVGARTSIYDAVLLGSRAPERRGEDRRRVIILVTDAGETTSNSDFDAARKEAVRSNALLYTIVIRPVKNESGRNTAGEHALETMTDTTGGAMFYPDTLQELGAIFDRIDRELRTQYLLAYYPTPRGPANTYRSIVVAVNPSRYHVRHRKSYLTGPQ